MTRTAHLLPHDGIGGVENAARAMADESDPANFRLLFIAEPAHAPDHAPTPSSYRSPLNPLAWLATVRRLLAYQPDVLIFSLWKSVPTALLFKLARPRTRLAYTLNSVHSVHWADRLATNIAMLFTDEVWSDSAATERARKPAAIKGRRIDYVRHGFVAPATFKPGPNFICWSRLHPDKGLDKAIQLIALLRQRGMDATLRLYGPDDGALPGLAAEAPRQGLTDVVHFDGPLPHEQIAGAASQCSFFLMPSKYEGMAMATVEAMQLGLIPVVTAVGEMAAYIRHGENGLILDPDRLDACAGDIAVLLGDPERFADMRSAAIAQWAHSPGYRASVEAAIHALVAHEA